MKTIAVTVLDFSGLFSRERALFPPELERDVHWDVLDFRSLDGTMCFCEEGSAEEIRRRLAEATSTPDAAAAVLLHWIDTGDYHYLTYFFLERIDRPFELVLLDNHPDDQPSVFGDGLLSCGGWVRTARERLPMLRAVERPGPEGRSARGERFRIKSGMTAGVTEGMLPVYISIDKDVLSREYARTDWSQGEMTLVELLEILERFRGREILGIDLCGGLTEAKGATAEDFAVNARLDTALISFINKIRF
ncbi:MAG: hypothetical protein IKX37_04315 [Bacteroidales bacterium]|nr:hypothetical protein [Bacteroidales bacterium]